MTRDGPGDRPPADIVGDRLGARPNPALLPAGLRDLLPPEAEAEAEAFAAIATCFAGHGYERVEPPLLEFEDTLLAGAGAAVAEAVFRTVDPESHRMMGLRPDMTPQVARIAATRMASAPRPLRLAYAGQCVTLRAGQLTSDRQIPQAGIELIGVDRPDADAEVITVGAEALAALGVERVSFDLTMPPLAPALIAEGGVAPSAREGLLRALDRKDVAAVRHHGGALADTLERLLLAAGPAPRALAVMAAAELPSGSRALCERLRATVDAVLRRAPALRLTIDPLEFRGWRYHTGVHVAIYAPGRAEELGRGGRYGGGDSGGEPACGLTLFPAAILRAAPIPPRRRRVFLPAGTPHAVGAGLRRIGFATVASLGEDAAVASTGAGATAASPGVGATATSPGAGAGAAAVAEARRLGCTHVLKGREPVAIGET